MQTNNKEIKVFALGGLGEIGKNCYVVEYLDQIFIIDAGVFFPDDSLPGVDYVIADYTYLVENQSKIVGLFITHGHEDHIGGIPYLAKKIKLNKIYASGIAVPLILAKFLEFKDLETPNIIEYNKDSKFNFKDVFITFIRMNHSIPDSYAIRIHTPYGNIIHTGDYKVDFTPAGPLAEYDKLALLGKEGVLLLLSDSTNATLEGYSKSEAIIKESIDDLFGKIKGRIIIATFASNLYRIEQIISSSVKYKRHIAVMGKSMEKAIEIGIKCGYIKAKPKDFINIEDVDKAEGKNITILCTGSQGEPMAALSRIASNNSKYIHLTKNDTIIFSSSPIPGNAEGVNKTINALFKAGANVIVNSPLSDTHTSGHANKGELRIIHSLLKEKYFMPIHGEYRMLKMHTKVATECGIKKENCFVMENGDILHLTDKNAFVKGKVYNGETYIDGNQIGDITPNILFERKQLSNDGMFMFIFNVGNKSRNLVGPVQVVSRGFIYMRQNEEFTKELINEATSFVLGELEKLKKNDFRFIASKLEKHMSDLIYLQSERKPMIIANFTLINE